MASNETPKAIPKALSKTVSFHNIPAEKDPVDGGLGDAGIEHLQPSLSVISQLDCVLLNQFGDMSELVPGDEEVDGIEPKEKKKKTKNVTIDAPEPVDDSDGNRRNSMKDMTLGALGSVGVGLFAEQSAESKQRPACVRVAENPIFKNSFMALTFYALFVPDVDMLCGSKSSKFIFSIVTFVVCILFVLELVVQSLGRHRYFLRAYFWLDLIAMVSLLPDTWLFDAVFNANAFVAGRSSRLTRLIRIASRSSKATRLNRLTRIVRVASLMPRIHAMLGRKVKDGATEKMLEKKLRRVFAFLDEDMDGLIAYSAVMSCFHKMKADEPNRSGSRVWKFTSRTFSAVNFMKKRSAIPETGESNSKESPMGAARSTTATSGTMVASPSIKTVRSTAATAGNYPVAGGDGPLELDADVLGASPSISHQEKAEGRKSKKRRTKKSVVSKRGSGEDEDEASPPDMVSYKEFREIMLGDTWVASRLRKACQAQLQEANNMRNLTSQHSEYIAIKVALGVLLMLFVLSMVEPAVEDNSAERGLKQITDLVKAKYNNQSSGQLIYPAVHEQVEVWRDGAGVIPNQRKVLYLDLVKKVYCNEFVASGPPCVWQEHAVPTTAVWGQRVKLEDIDRDIMSSNYRVADLTYINVPNLQDDDLSSEELDEKTLSVVVLFIRGETQKVAVMSILTTILVIIIILSGIVLLTKDMTFLSRNLLKPLKELADDMESIAQLQLAGVSNVEDTVVEEGTSEVRLIRRTFENMKKAIKSWGKYVPWPVVQTILRANIEANLAVEELEVTIFFSDIAGFTGFVETLPPESSLLLLSRYFNDMSQVIDEHGGVVLEFIGDAIQCIYGAPLANADHPTAAVKAALRMLAALRRMNEWSQRKGLPVVSIRCGIHTGRVLVGNMGFNMGFHSRMKYGVVGEDARIPSMLEELNKSYSTNMLISAHTHSMIIDEPTSAFIVRPIDILPLVSAPGAPAEIVYEVMDRDKRNAKSNPLLAVAGLHEEAFEKYRKREFQGAAESYAEVGRQMEEITGHEDGASSVMLQRCEAYMLEPPGENWRCVWDRGVS